MGKTKIYPVEAEASKDKGKKPHTHRFEFICEFGSYLDGSVKWCKTCGALKIKDCSTN